MPSAKLPEARQVATSDGFAARWLGKRGDMASDVEVDRALHTITARLNDQELEELDTDRIQEIVTESLGGDPKLTVDDGGGLHDETGARVAALRRTGSGEWLAERQNAGAERSDTAVPSPPPQGKLRSLLTKIKVLGG